MELIHDIAFKRNIYGYTEESRVQVYQFWLRQIPVWIVYHPHNEQYDHQSVEENGLYFLNMAVMIDYFDKFKKAWMSDGEYIPSIDLCIDAINTTKAVKPDPNGLMYRVVFKCNDPGLGMYAIGEVPLSKGEPWFVSCEPNQNNIGRWCIYNENLARAVMHTVASYGGGVYECVRNLLGDGYFIVQSTPYNSTGVPLDGEVWTNVVSNSYMGSYAKFGFNADISQVVIIND